MGALVPLTKKLALKNPLLERVLDNGAKRIRTADPLHAMQWAVWLRAAALHALWEFVALCFAPNPAPALGRLSRSAGGAQARWGHRINQGHCRRC